MNERGWDGLCQVAYGDGFDQGHKKGYESGNARGAAAERARIVAWGKGPDGRSVAAAAIRGAIADGLTAANDLTEHVLTALTQAIERGEHDAAGPAPRKPLFEIDPQARAGKEPCGECHILPGETCNICGAHQADAAGRGDKA